MHAKKHILAMLKSIKKYQCSYVCQNRHGGVGRHMAALGGMLQDGPGPCARPRATEPLPHPGCNPETT